MTVFASFGLKAIRKQFKHYLSFHSNMEGQAYRKVSQTINHKKDVIKNNPILQSHLVWKQMKKKSK